MDIRKNERITNKIKVFGIVQGVGFRPLVYHIAKNLGITGTVCNIGGYVEIMVSASEQVIETFLETLTSSACESCEIIKIEVEAHPYNHWEDFVIVGSHESSQVSIIPPDLPVCSHCQAELYVESNRRYHNPFISCMSCGPRYTIIEELPYDRMNTTMLDFEMCTECMTEYTSPEHRRFHAQTISCDDCGPYLLFQDVKNDKIDDALKKAITILKSGGIIAVKGIGGYHFVCSPFLEDSVQNLRKLKGREEKPFAVMFEHMQSIQLFCDASKEESALLQTKARPIVLLAMHNRSMAPSTNKGSIYCGAFLPYTPLQLLLTKECGPLIMTSANISDQPIMKEDEVVLSMQSIYLNGVLYNRRRIVRSVDDSVAKIVDGKPQIIRRSRGYVPYPVFLQGRDANPQISCQYEDATIFSAGGDLKAAFCLYKDGKAVLSQHFGDLEEIAVLNEYERAYTDLTRLLKINPSLAVCDYHPNYHSSKYCQELNLPVLQVQHHHAHIASVMAEHDLKDRVIGIAFDGTGYGMDGNVWGGEFLICDGADFVRAAHLAYTPMLGGDESMKDAKKTATCFLLEAGLVEGVMDDRKNMIQAALTHKINTVLSSSAGRLFDAAASILGICQRNRYEGECAALLEQEAILAIRDGRKPTKLSFAISKENEIIKINPKPILKALIKLRDTSDIGALALGFHYAIAQAVGETCESLREIYCSNTVAMSGGVFQNTLLAELVLKELRQKEFKVYMNHAVPPNDGGISLGQTYIALNRYKEK